MVLVAAYGGLRFGELTALTRADLHLEDPDPPAVVVRQTMTRLHGTWMVGTPKSAGLRTVTLPRFLHPHLDDHLQRYVRKGDGALVFAAATAAVQTCAPLKDTMARLGHASPRAALIRNTATGWRAALVGSTSTAGPPAIA